MNLIERLLEIFEQRLGTILIFVFLFSAMIIRPERADDFVVGIILSIFATSFFEFINNNT